jgi:hypothetical protein
VSARAVRRPRHGPAPAWLRQTLIRFGNLAWIAQVETIRVRRGTISRFCSGGTRDAYELERRGTSWLPVDDVRWHSHCRSLFRI